jgi:hypothetical protein
MLSGLQVKFTYLLRRLYSDGSINPGRAELTKRIPLIKWFKDTTRMLRDTGSNAQGAAQHAEEKLQEALQEQQALAQQAEAALNDPELVSQLRLVLFVLPACRCIVTDLDKWYCL